MDQKIAHINKDGKAQTVKDHSFNVARFCEKMGKELKIGTLCYIAGLLHDNGKYGRFQNYISMEDKKQQRALKGTINHSSAGAQFLLKEYGQGKGGIREITAQVIAGAIFSHHGLYDFINLKEENIFRERCFPKTDIEYEIVKEYIEAEIVSEVNFEKLLEEAGRELFQFINKIKSLSIKEKNSGIYIYLAYLERLVLSILVDSDRADTYDVMDGTQKRKWWTVEEKEKIWEENKICLEQYLSQARFQKQDVISQLRREISKECLEFSSYGTGIYQLPVPTGAGKTIASLRFAFSHAKKYRKERIFYIAPYRSILEQTAEEIRRILKEESQLLEFHSNVIPDDVLEYQFLNENWENPMIATTLVRLSETLFSNKMQAVRRFHQLTNSILIIDEVQNIPVKMVHLFNTMMNFLCYVCNTTIILCTATQPMLEKVEHPIHLSEPKIMIQNLEERYLAFQRVHIYKGGDTLGVTSEQAGQFLYEKIREFQSILMIVNTKKTAETIYNFVKDRESDCILEEPVLIYYLTGNMCPQHRIDVLEQIRENLGERRLICIATQLIEAGIDISFECVIRSMAGLDNLIQAGGRCNRHGEREYGSVFLIDIIDEKLKSLDDIQIGKEILRKQLVSKNDGDCLDEFLSVGAVEWYYKNYFFKRKEEMNYNITVEGVKQSIFSLLRGKHASQKDKRKLFCTAAFKTAGENFELIGSQTIGVLVPYKKGKEYISILNGEDVEKKKEILPLVQRYTVNLYENKYKELMKEGAIYQIEFGNVLILDDAHYDEIIGVTGIAKMDFLFV